MPNRDERAKIDHRANYTKVGGPVDPSTCTLTEDEIRDLIRERIQSRRVHDFEQADKILQKLKASGVDVDDKLKQWRFDVLNEHGHDFTRVGGPIDPAVCTLDEDEIHKLFRERTQLVRARSFRDADRIRMELRRSGVKVDDRLKQWRADGILADGTKLGPALQIGAGPEDTFNHPGNRDPTKNVGVMNRYGHIYTEVGARMNVSVVKLPLSEIHNLLRERMLAKRAHDFEKADEIQNKLRDNGVNVDDKLKEWRADVFNERGHEYSYVGEPFETMDMTMSEEEIHGLIRERSKCKRERDFEKAEMIQRKLWSVGVELEDKQKLWLTFRPRNKKKPPKRSKDATATRSSSRRRNVNTNGMSSSSPKMKDCKTIEEAIKMSMEDSEQLTTRRVSAFWAVVPRLLDEYLERPTHEELPESNKLAKILSLTMGNIKSFSPRELSTTTLGLARIVKMVGKGNHHEMDFPVGSPNKKLHKILLDPEMKHHIFRKIANASMRVLPEFDARRLANLCYAYAIADYLPEIEDGSALFDHIAEKSIPLLRTFKYQELSSMLWAYAHLNMSHPGLFQEAGDVIVSLDSLRNFTGQALSNILWSYATVKEQHPGLFGMVADHVLSLSKLDRLGTQDLSNLLWAYASAEFSCPLLFKRVADYLVSLDDLSEFRAQYLSNIPWAYATAKEPHPKLFEKIAEVAIERQTEFTSQGIANFVWAYATNGQVNEHLFTLLAPSVERLLGSCNDQELSNVAWAYSAANVVPPSLFNDAFINACLAKEEEFHTEGLSQLHQWQLWQEELESDIGLPPSLREKCYESFVSQSPERSAMQDDVISELASIGLRPAVEMLTERGYRLDALVDVNGKKVAVEVDGPFHFVGRKPTGKMILKHRQVTTLEKIRVTSVPYWEWDELGTDSCKKQIYLRLLLDLF